MKQTVYCLLLVYVLSVNLMSAQTEPIASQVDKGEPVSEISNDVRELEGIVVDGRRIRMEDNKVIGVPTKAEKNLSNTPASLLESMQFPGVKINGDNILTSGDQPVDIFINGVPVTDVDYKTFRPKHTVRVEYMVHPSEPTFLGSAYVVNFIVQEPEIGGVTKIDVSQHFPNHGAYQIGSKLNYNKISYGILFDTYYERNHSLKETGTETFRDILYEGTVYPILERTYSQNSVDRSKYYNLSINSRYLGPGLNMVHTVGLGWWRDPGSGSDDSQEWHPEVFTALSAMSRNSSKSFSPQISGSYWRPIDNRWKILRFTWRYAHSRNDRESHFAQTGMVPIENGTQENSDLLRLILTTMYTVRDKFYLILKGNSEFNWYHMWYTGSADVRQTQHRQTLTATADMTYYFSPSLVASLTPGIDFNAWQVGDVSECYVSPTAKAGLWWTCSSKCRLGMNVNCLIRPVGAANTNPVTTQVSDLIWQRGNPYLRGGRIWSFIVNGVFSPCNAVDISGNIMHERDENQIIQSYTLNHGPEGGLLRDFINADPFSYTLVNAGVSGRLLDGRFTYSVSGDYIYSHSADKNVPFKSVSSVSGQADIGYRVGNVRLNIHYSSPYRFISVMQAGRERIRYKNSWRAELTYGTGDWYLSLKVYNIFRKRSQDRITYITPHYSREVLSENIGRRFVVNVSYSFGYGRKTDRSIDIDATEQTSSSVL